MQELYLNARKESELEEGNGTAEENENKNKLKRKRITIGLQLTYIYDWKLFFKPVVNTNIKYFQVPHRFRVRRFNDVAVCQYMLFTDESLEKEEWLPHVGSFKSSDDPIMHEAFIQLHELGVVNGLPDYWY